MNEHVYQKLKESGLKVTAQRIAVYNALVGIEHHPVVDEIIRKVQSENPSISVGTIYNILDAFVEKGLVHRVKTEKGAMLYDAVEHHHHHLFDKNSGEIRDYFDEQLTSMIREYLANSAISGFKVDDIQLHISGKFEKQSD